MNLLETLQAGLNHDKQRGLVTKAIAIAEVVSPEDGAQRLVVLGSECPLWDAVGMLEVVRADITDMYVQIENVEYGED